MQQPTEKPLKENTNILCQNLAKVLEVVMHLYEFSIAMGKMTFSDHLLFTLSMSGLHVDVSLPSTICSSLCQLSF